MTNRALKNKSSVVKTESGFFIQLLIVVVLATITTIPFIFDSFTVSKLLVLSIGLLYIAICIFLKKDEVGNRNLPLWITVPVGLFGISLTLSWALSGVPILRGLFGQFGRGNGLFYYYLALLVFIFSIKTFRKANSLKIHQIITGLSWFLAIYATLQKIGIDVAKLDTKGLSPVVLTFGNSNFAGGMLSVFFTYHFIYLVISGKYRATNLTLLTSLLISATFAAAVQGYLIITFGLAIGITIKLSHKYKSLAINIGLTLLWLIGITTLILGVSGKFVLSSIFARPSFQARIEYWRITLKVIRDNLLFGIGPDKLYDVTPNYMAPGSLKLITTTRMDNAHNWYLNLIANFGLISGLMLMVIIGIVIFSAVMFLRGQDKKNPLILGSIVTYLALLIDGLVSIEQPGLGVWLYLFGGLIVGAYLDSKPNTAPENQTVKNSRKIQFVILKSIAGLNVLILVITSLLISSRVYNDALLRSNVQTAMLNQGTIETFLNIEKAAIRLNSEPEYTVQALRPIAAIGDAKKLDSISSASYQYYKDSIQANLVRADILRALGRESDSCALRPLLVSNTPWDKSHLEKYLFCINQGLMDPNLATTLELAKKYLEPIDNPTTSQSPDDLIVLQRQFIQNSTYAYFFYLQRDIPLARNYQVKAKYLLAQVENLELTIVDKSKVLDKREYLRIINF
jgi:O-antigen ligase